MENRPFFIIGAGGFGREVFELCLALAGDGARVFVDGFLDDSPSPENLERVAALGSRVVGNVDSLATLANGATAVIAIGSRTGREAVSGRLSHLSVAYPVLVHPAATIGRHVTLGPGAVVSAGARLSTNIVVGEHVHVDQNATIGHDTTVGDYSRLNPASSVAGDVRIGRHVLVGSNATILEGRVVGDRSVVGAGACVVSDVPEDVVAKGVPARWTRGTDERGSRGDS